MTRCFYSLAVVTGQLDLSVFEPSKMQAVIALEMFKKPAELCYVEVVSQKIPKILFGKARKLQRLKLWYEIQLL